MSSTKKILLSLSSNKKNCLKSFRHTFNRFSLKNFYYTIGEYDTTKKNSILVYSAPEIEEINSHYSKTNEGKLQLISDHARIWKSFIQSSNSDIVKKYYALIPTFFENKFAFNRDVRFILQMSLIPENKTLGFKCLEASGVVEFEEKLEDVVPITAHDFVIKKRILRGYLPDFVDGDMLYSNHKSLTTFCFDKQGTWHKDGVNHELLNLENSFNEKKWFDHIYWDNEWK